MDEAALLRRIGDPDVMGGQLARLLELAAHPRVRIGVLPLDGAAHHSVLTAFTLLRFADADDLVTYDHQAGTATSGSDISLHGSAREHFENLSAAAVHGDLAAELIDQAMPAPAREGSTAGTPCRPCACR